MVVGLLSVDAFFGAAAQDNPWVSIALDHSTDKSVAERETKQLVQFDYERRSYQILSRTLYRANGSAISTNNEAPNKYRYAYAPLDTVIEAALNKACPA